jgi:hypothetical protein
MPWSTCHRRCVAFVALMCLASQAISADHRDGPRVVDSVKTLGAMDLNDLYVFVSPANSRNTVLILTTGGLDVGIIGPPTFFPGAVYEIRVSNDGVKTTDEFVLQAVFSNPDKFGRQNYTVRMIRQNRGNDPSVLARGVTGQPIAGSLGVKVQAGIFDDPFFFDLDAFGKFRTAVQQGKGLADRVAPFLPPNKPMNGFKKNTLAIVFEVPRNELQSSPSNPNITVWQRCVAPDGTKFDRMGFPAINTAVGFGFADKPNIQDFFNGLTPASDEGLRGEAADRINKIYGLPLDKATQLAEVLLPDVMPFNTTNKSGFLNGRRLEDDVIDAELNLLTGGALKEDRVGNDSTFLTKFPYLAAAKK